MPKFKKYIRMLFLSKRRNYYNIFIDLKSEYSKQSDWSGCSRVRNDKTEKQQYHQYLLCLSFDVVVHVHMLILPCINVLLSLKCKLMKKGLWSRSYTLDHCIRRIRIRIAMDASSL